MKKYYQGRTIQLQTEIDKILEYIDHDLSRGLHAEEILREFLRQELSDRYRIDSGFVITPDRNISKQIDIIIHDPFYSPPLQSMKGFKLFPAESVYACISVKLTLNKDSLISGSCNAFENIESVKIKPKNHVLKKKFGSITSTRQFSTPTIGCVFAFKSETSLETIKSNLEDYLKNKALTIDEYSLKYPDIICTLDKGIIIANPKKHKFKSEDNFIAIKGDHLMNFILSIHTILNQIELMPVNLFDYMD